MAHKLYELEMPEFLSETVEEGIRRPKGTWNAEVVTCYETRRPTRASYSRGIPREHTTHQGRMEGAGVRVPASLIMISLSFEWKRRF